MFYPVSPGVDTAARSHYPSVLLNAVIKCLSKFHEDIDSILILNGKIYVSSAANMALSQMHGLSLICRDYNALFI